MEALSVRSGRLLDHYCLQLPLPDCEQGVITGQLQNGKHGSKLWGKPRFHVDVSDFHTREDEEHPSLLTEYGAHICESSWARWYLLLSSVDLWFLFQQTWKVYWWSAAWFLSFFLSTVKMWCIKGQNHTQNAKKKKKKIGWLNYWSYQWKGEKHKRPSKLLVSLVWYGLNFKYKFLKNHTN